MIPHWVIYTFSWLGILSVIFAAALWLLFALAAAKNRKTKNIGDR